jgi:hypothetical protein
MTRQRRACPGRKVDEGRLAWVCGIEEVAFRHRPSRRKCQLGANSCKRYWLIEGTRISVADGGE